MKRRGFFKLLGSIGLAPALPAAAKAAESVAAAVAPIAAAPASTLGMTAAAGAISNIMLSRERMGNVLAGYADYGFGNADEAIAAHVRAHVEISVRGECDVNPGDIIDRAWLERYTAAPHILANFPEGMSFEVELVTREVSVNDQIITRIDATEQ